MARAILQHAMQSVESRLWPATAALEQAYLQRPADPGLQDVTFDLDLLKETVIYLRQQGVLLR